MAEEGLSPLEATRKSMDQITGALIGIALVLSAVFVPMAFFGGSTGAIYRQFSLTIVSAMLLSVVVALVLTPALCATLLKPVQQGAQPGEARLLRLVQPHLRAQRRHLPHLRRLRAQAHRPFRHHLPGDAHRGRLVLRQAADQLHSRGGPGRVPHHGAAAHRRHPGAHPGGAGPGARALPGRGEGEHQFRLYRGRVQLRRPGPEHGHVLRAAQALGRAHPARPVGQGDHRPGHGRLLADQGGHGLPVQHPADPGAGLLHRL